MNMVGPESKPSAAKRFTSARRVLILALCLPIASFMYLLILGPLFGLSTSGLIPHSLFRSFYRPVSYIEQTAPVLYRFNDWYFALWDGRKRSLQQVEEQFNKLEQTNRP
jgi:hypothetical protein